MELFPRLETGWLNGWILLITEFCPQPAGGCPPASWPDRRPGWATSLVSIFQYAG